MHISVWVLTVSTLLCPLILFLRGRGLRGLSGDPAFAERLNRYRGQMILTPIFLGCFSIFVCFFLAEGSEPNYLWPLAFPTVCLSVLLHLLTGSIGAFPVRRGLLGDGQSYLPGLWFSMRFSFAFMGQFLLLLNLPFLVAAYPASPWLLAGLFLVVLSLWSLYPGSLTLRILGASPLEDSRLLPRFQQIVDTSGIDDAKVFVFAAEESYFANAFAFIGTQKPMVIMSRPLLRKLDPEQSAAIFAHEVAHLEDRDEIRVKTWQMLSMIGVACCIAPILGWFLGPTTVGWLYIWPIFLLFSAVKQQQSHKHHETAGDLRAAELCGNSEVLIEALTVLHEMNHQPRRMQAELERQSTHPSLARRISAIREAQTDLEPPEVPPIRARNDLCFLSRDDQTQLLIMDRNRLQLLRLGQSVNQTPNREALEGLKHKAKHLQAFAYSDLVELRLILKGQNHQLRIVDTKGKVITFSPRSEQVQSLSRQLDLVDDQFAPLGTTNPIGILVLASLVVGFGGFAASIWGTLSGGVIWLLIGTILALIFRQKVWLSAQGAMGLGACIFTLFIQTDKSWWSLGGWIALILVGLCGLVLLVKAPQFEQRDMAGMPLLPETRPIVVAMIFLVLGLLFLSPVLLFMLEGEIAIKLYGLGNHGSGRFMPILASATALFYTRGLGKFFALVLTLIGLTPIWAISDPFLNLTDKLAQEMPEPEVEMSEYNVLASRSLDRNYWGLQLSSDGKWFSLINYQNDGDAYPWHYELHDFTNQTIKLQAIRLGFVGATHLLILEPRDGESVLRYAPIQNPDQTLWELPLEITGADDPRLEVGSRGWRILAGGANHKTICLEGDLLGNPPQRRVWSHPEVMEQNRYVGTGEDLLQLSRGTLDRGDAMSLERVKWAFFSFYYPNHLSFVSSENLKPIAKTAMWLDVLAPRHGTEGPFHVLIFGHQKSRWWTLQPDGKLLPGYEVDYLRNWSWDGQQLLSVWGKELYLYDMETGRTKRLSLPREADWGVANASMGSWIALAWPTPSGKTVVELIRIE